MMTFTVKLYNYPHFFYEFQVNIYNYLGDVYEPTVTWKAGDSAHIDRIEFYKDPATGVFYIRPIIEVAYSRIAITDVQAYGETTHFVFQLGCCLGRRCYTTASPIYNIKH